MNRTLLCLTRDPSHWRGIYSSTAASSDCAAKNIKIVKTASFFACRTRHMCVATNCRPSTYPVRPSCSKVRSHQHKCAAAERHPHHAAAKCCNHRYHDGRRRGGLAAAVGPRSLPRSRMARPLWLDGIFLRGRVSLLRRAAVKNIVKYLKERVRRNQINVCAASLSRPRSVSIPCCTLNERAVVLPRHSR